MLISGAIDFCIPIERSHSRPLGQWSASAIPVADVHEIVAGKLCAAWERNHSRDLYDVRLLPQSEWLAFDKRQSAFLVTAASPPASIVGAARPKISILTYWKPKSMPVPGYGANARTPFPNNASRDFLMFWLTRYAYRSHTALQLGG